LILSRFGIIFALQNDLRVRAFAHSGIGLSSWVRNGVFFSDLNRSSVHLFGDDTIGGGKSGSFDEIGVGFDDGALVGEAFFGWDR